MTGLRRLLVTSSVRWVTLALAAATVLPALRDLHVLADAHAAAHELSPVLPAPGSPPIAEGCAHGLARHVEQSTTSERSRCDACLHRSQLGLVAALASREARPLAHQPAPIASEQPTNARPVVASSPRGPPRS